MTTERATAIEEAKRILYRLAGENGITEAGCSTLMEAIFYLGHGRYSRIRSLKSSGHRVISWSRERVILDGEVSA